MGISYQDYESSASSSIYFLDTDSNLLFFIMGDSIKDLVVLITGSTSGIGRGCAVEFARWGAKLAITGRDVDRLQLTADRCMEQGLSKKNIFMTTGDVTIKEDVDRIMEETVAHYGRLDVLLNNAGATRARNIDNCTIEDLDWCYDVLVRSVFMMSKAAIPHLEKTKGAILNMSSLSGLRPLHYAVPYSMCKYIVWSCKAIPVGRVGEISEVAKLVVFLASKDGNFMSGIQFPIDGAYSLSSYHPKVPTAAEQK